MHHHPYYPRDMQLPGYVPNTTPTLTILLVFFVACALVTAIGMRISTGLTRGNRFAVIWFSICGCIHTFFEGYFVLNHRTLSADTLLFGQVWKEYAFSDSRYLSSDASVLVIEFLTAFIEGPLCFVTVYAILYGQRYRHALQLCISMGQLYGCVMYYATSWLDGWKYNHPAAQYFYGYFVLMNLPWIVIPMHLITISVKHINNSEPISKKTK